VLLPVKTAQFTQFFPSVARNTAADGYTAMERMDCNNYRWKAAKQSKDRRRGRRRRRRRKSRRRRRRKRRRMRRRRRRRRRKKKKKEKE
jgi:hypothetical protein